MQPQADQNMLTSIGELW